MADTVVSDGRIAWPRNERGQTVNATKAIEVPVQYRYEKSGDGAYYSHFVGGSWGVLMVEGGSPCGYSIGGWGANDLGRLVEGGPLVAGPVAWANECATVLTSNPLTSAQQCAKRASDIASGLRVECSPGDVLSLNGDTFVVHMDRYGNVRLAHVA